MLEIEPLAVVFGLSMTKDRCLIDVVQELKTVLTGWQACFGIAEVLSPLREIDKDWPTRAAG